MLKHDETQHLPATQQRVTAEELARAVSALDEARAAEQISGTAPIGQVVQELNLDATPEEIWAQVQVQRAQDAAKTSTQTARVLPAARQVQRRRKVKGWVLVVLACTGGLGLLAHLNQPGRPPANIAAARMLIDGDGQTLAVDAQGKYVTVGGSRNTITLHGDCPTLYISGSGNHIQIQGKVQQVSPGGDSNIVTYTTLPAPTLLKNGNSNRLESATVHLGQ